MASHCADHQLSGAGGAVARKLAKERQLSLQLSINEAAEPLGYEGRKHGLELREAKLPSGFTALRMKMAGELSLMPHFRAEDLLRPA